jgi:hypothetical protein
VEAEFINVFIAKQKTWIEELIAKHIMLEAKLQLTEQRLGEKLKEIESLTYAVEEKNHHINKLVQLNNNKQKEIADLESLRFESPVEVVVPQTRQRKKKVEESVSADEF